MEVEQHSSCKTVLNHGVTDFCSAGFAQSRNHSLTKIFITTQKVEISFTRKQNSFCQEKKGSQFLTVTWFVIHTQTNLWFPSVSVNAQPLPTVCFEVTCQTGQITLNVSQNQKQKKTCHVVRTCAQNCQTPTLFLFLRHRIHPKPHSPNRKIMPTL